MSVPRFDPRPKDAEPDAPALPTGWVYGSEPFEPMRMTASLSVLEGEIVPSDATTSRRLLSLNDLAREAKMTPGAPIRIRDKALRSLFEPSLDKSRINEYAHVLGAYFGRPVRRWLLDRHRIDIGDQEVSWSYDADSGVVTVNVPPPGPGVLDAAPQADTESRSILEPDDVLVLSGLRRAEHVGAVRFVPMGLGTEEADATEPNDLFKGVDPVWFHKDAGHATAAEAIRDIPAQLFDTGRGWIAFRTGMPRALSRNVTLHDLESDVGRRQTFFASALNAFLESISDAYVASGHRGISLRRVSSIRDEPGSLSPEQPDHEPGVLVYEIGFARIGETRAVVRESRGDPVTDSPQGLRIVSNSPAARGDFINQHSLDDFVFRLNRNPSRRVDLALSHVQGESVDLDYLVTTSRPWSIYAQLSNTGTPQTTELRERFGFANYNLSGVDDTLFIDYVTGNFDEVHAVFASYERPFSCHDRLRWRAFASYSQYDASQVGLGALDFQGKTAGGGAELIWNFFQKRSFFAEATAGARFEHVEVSNNAGTDTDNQFLLPYVGLRCDMRSDVADIAADLAAEFSLPDAAGTETDSIDQLGRFDSDDSWEILRGGVSASIFLENLIAPDQIAQGRGTLANELAISMRGFGSLGDRLPPNYAETAGGFYSVRGYPEAFAVGDIVVTGSAEYRFHVPRALDAYTDTGETPGKFFGQDFNWRPPRPLTRPDWDLVIKAFFDAGTVRTQHRLAFENNTTLYSAGIGAELVMGRGFTARVDWGIVLRDDDTGQGNANEGDSRVHFVITLLF